MEPDEELDAVVEEALALRDQGRIEETISLVEGIHQKGIFYARALMVLANLLRRKGELEKAFSIMQILEKLAPEDPAVLLNSAALLVQMARPEEARDRMKKINRKGLPEDFLEKLKVLEEQIEEQELFQGLPRRLIYEYEEEQRRCIEEKALPVDPTLARGFSGGTAPTFKGNVGLSWGAYFCHQVVTAKLSMTTLPPGVDPGSKRPVWGLSPGTPAHAAVSCLKLPERRQAPDHRGWRWAKGPPAYCLPAWAW
jgi:tetratricopeptide (TPR) repeat protein